MDLHVAVRIGDVHVNSDALIPLVVVTGPTASGKSLWALSLAEHFSGEIIIADSRQIYRGMDIGTAKPITDDQRRVPHHLLDIRDPSMEFTVAEYLPLARTKIQEIWARGHLPFMVGGTGLYIRALLHGFEFGTAPRPDWRKEMEDVPHKHLVAQLIKKDPARASGIDLNNPRRVLRALEDVTFGEERGSLAISKDSSPYTTVMISPEIHPEILRQRIDQRVSEMIDRGLQTEVSHLVEQYGWDAPGLQSIGYQEWQPFFRGQQTISQTKALIRNATRAYARRQRIWFRKETSLRFLSSLQEAFPLISMLRSK